MKAHTASTIPVAVNENDDERSWFCVQTHPKHEHIAATGLSRLGGFEVFNPRIRIRRATKRGPVWFLESAFPGYLFVRLNLHLHYHTVRYWSSVSRVVRFRSGFPCIPDDQVGDLRTIFGPDDMLILDTEVSVGDSVRIVGGAFHELVAVVQQVRPAQQRALALLDFLGRMTIVELDLHKVVVVERGQQARPLEGRQERFTELEMIPAE